MSDQSSTGAGWNFEYSYTELPELLYTKQMPTPVSSPKLLLFNEKLATSLGLDVGELTSTEGINTLSGNACPPGAQPLAQAYAGHQFGNFTMLGDGRAILLGEQMTPNGKLYDIQLKGSGKTPYSRGGDGRAALGPMLREYLISEAMHGLGVDTNRSLGVVSTGEFVYRETPLPGAVLTRVAKSHLRFGTFEYVFRWGTEDDLKALAEYAINRHYPQIKKESHPYLSLLNEVIKVHAKQIAKWQLVGFVHGVMNTDNMTISGETIDYGPCAFMNTYDPATVFSSIDVQGRYAYGNQPYMGAWNLSRFAESLLPLLSEDKEEAVSRAQEAISNFSKEYHREWYSGMRAKLGLFDEEDEDKTLIDRLLGMMEKSESDFTNTFLDLTFGQSNETKKIERFSEWESLWNSRLKRQNEDSSATFELMKRSNPAVIPRNHQVEEALEAAVTEGDMGKIEKLLLVLEDPYAHKGEQKAFNSPPDTSAPPYQTYCGT
ncbi:protein adenylyltransferase SelO [Alteribacter aurantiacus]|uniref:protein adenylyltransferase SelO n=1 Tax=Alteribacter aurantiacus TaxID=254410 RepID=UPI000428A8F5|nr:YdiU family protein [Alteribacter aurantiacus]